MTATDTDTRAVRTGTELAHWLLPLLKEYTDKLNGLGDRYAAVAQIPWASPAVGFSQLARFLNSQATLKEILLGYARTASGLLDHYEFDDGELKLELTGRWREAEDAVRQSDLLVRSTSVLAKERRITKELDAVLEQLR